MFARQINDFETYTYATTETTSYSPPTFYWKLNTIQAKQITLFLAFFFLSHFFFSKEPYSFSLFFFSSPLFFFNYNKKKMLPHTCLLVTTIQFPKQRTQEVTIIVLQTHETKVRWCGWTKKTANEWSVQKGFQKFVFRWMVNTLAIVFN